MDDIYQKVGYGSGSVGFGEKIAILVVDFQAAFTEHQYPLGNSPLIHQAVDKTTALLDLARHLSISITSCYTAYHSSDISAVRPPR